jgi:selenide,water dikinase
MVFPRDQHVIVGLDQADDAGVYKISDDLALIQTVDFFTPIVDDPYWFGQIAAANALSDVYAMGGIPKTAMNLVAFPVKNMELSVMREIIQGGIDKLEEAQVVMLGGHSIEDRELKYGLSVTGYVHPDRVLTKKRLRPGDRLILTKPLGTGIVNTAIKAGMASDDLTYKVTRLMASLNRDAAKVMSNFQVSACTDITGFGLLGHLYEMVCGSGMSVRIFSEQVPVIPEALEFASMGFIPAGAYKNREFSQSRIIFGKKVALSMQDLFFDPQTSGGLLMSSDPGHATQLMTALKHTGIKDAAEIGEILNDPEERICVI